MIVLDLIIPFSIAMETVFEISISSKSISLSRSFLNLVSVLGLITPSSGDMPKKYLKDMSYMERSTTSTSEES